MLYRFADCELDVESLELRRSGVPVEIQPKALTLILFLLGERHRVCSKEELMGVLWPDVVVSDDALASVLRKARRAVGDEGVRQHVIATNRRLGYRFVAAVEECAPAAGREADARSVEGRPGLGAVDAELVGREALIAQLQAQLEQACEGRGHLLWLAGDPGIGKTRIAEALGRMADARGTQVCWGWAWEGSGSPGFWLWAQVLEVLVESLDEQELAAALGADAGTIAQVLPSAPWARLGELPRPVRAEPDEARFRLLVAIARFLKRRARERPLVLLLEDLHWADPGSLLMLRFLSRELRSTRLLVVATYRDAELEAQPLLREAVADVLRQPGCDEVRIEPLTRDECGLLSRTIAGVDLPAVLVDLLHERTGGNPFFLRESLRSQAVTALAHDPSPDAERLSAAVREIPPAVQKLVGQRLGRLSPDSRRLVELAVVAGQQVDLALLGHALGRPGSALLAPLEEAIEARILATLPEPEWHAGFLHPLVRSSIYEQISAADRAELHRRVGEALEKLHADDLEPHAARLAHHFGEALLLLGGAKAVWYSRVAGDRARERLAYEEAADHFERALTALSFCPEPSPALRAELLVALGGALLDAGQAERSRAVFRQATGVARSARKPVLFACAALGYAELGFLAFLDPEAIGLLEEALAGLGKEDSRIRSWVMSSLAVHLANDPHGRGARLGAVLECNDALARRLRDPHTLGYALNSRASCLRLAATDRLPERLAAVEEAIESGRQLGDPLLVVMARWLEVGAMMELGDGRRADASFEQLRVALERLQSPTWSWVVPAYRAMRSLLAGRYEDTLRFANEAYSPDSLVRKPADPLRLWVLTAMVRYDQGRADEMLAGGELVAARFHWIPAVPAALSVGSFVAGEIGASRRHFEHLAREDFADVVGRETWQAALAMAAETCALLGDASRAQRLYDLLAPLRAYCVVGGHVSACGGPVSRYLGMLATLLRQWKLADACFDESLERCHALDAATYAARTRVDRAIMHVTRGARGDAAAARQHLDAAREAAHDLGMGELLQRIDRLGRPLGSPQHA